MNTLQVESLRKFTIFYVSTSSFKYEKLIDDWLDLAVLEAGKLGSAPKNRLVGDAATHNGLLNRESLRAEDGVMYFRDTLRPHFLKRVQNVYLWRFYQIIRARRGDMETVKWIGMFSLLLKRLGDAWMDMLPMNATSEEVTTLERFIFIQR